jgi:hypothetical protein
MLLPIKVLGRSVATYSRCILTLCLLCLPLQAQLFPLPLTWRREAGL